MQTETLMMLVRPCDALLASAWSRPRPPRPLDLLRAAICRVLWQTTAEKVRDALRAGTEIVLRWDGGDVVLTETSIVWGDPHGLCWMQGNQTGYVVWPLVDQLVGAWWAQATVRD